MTDITPFDFQGNAVRVLTIDGEPWFAASDVAARLGYVNDRDAIARHVDLEDRQSVVNPDVTRGNPNLTVINESGVFALIFGSKLPAAKEFKRWVTAEVLPQIRKTGSYALATMDPLDQAQMMLDAIRADRARLANLETAVLAIAAKQSAHDGEYDEFTTLAYAKLNDLPTDRISCQRHGQRASRLMRARGQEPRKRQDATFGTVNVYPVSVLEETAEG